MAASELPMDSLSWVHNRNAAYSGFEGQMVSTIVNGKYHSHHINLADSSQDFARADLCGEIHSNKSKCCGTNRWTSDDSHTSPVAFECGNEFEGTLPHTVPNVAKEQAGSLSSLGYCSPFKDRDDWISILQHRQKLLINVSLSLKARIIGSIDT
ncbi:MAG: hypothetical protein M1821_004707 [Bathelium mastoideum]|nr:MAG: hypothetical protein M1821_004707 [Bathelium mastoideum]